VRIDLAVAMSCLGVLGQIGVGAIRVVRCSSNGHGIVPRQLWLSVTFTSIFLPKFGAPLRSSELHIPYPVPYLGCYVVIRVLVSRGLPI
jgi:hypothetical protein